MTCYINTLNSPIFIIWFTLLYILCVTTIKSKTFKHRVLVLSCYTNETLRVWLMIKIVICLCL